MTGDLPGSCNNIGRPSLSDLAPRCNDIAGNLSAQLRNGDYELTFDQGTAMMPFGIGVATGGLGMLVAKTFEPMY